MIGGDLNERLRRALRAIGAMRTVRGLRVFVPSGFELPIRNSHCDVCKSAGQHECGPSVTMKLLGRRTPALRICLCDACHLRMCQRFLWSMSTMVLAFVVGVGFAWLANVLWPWASWWALVSVSAMGIVGAFFVGLLLPGRLASGSRAWQGKPARVVALREDGWVVEVVSRSLVAHLANHRICAVNASDEAELDEAGQDVVENDVVPTLIGGVVAVALVGAVLWWSWHPEVRVVNVTNQPLEIVVDGRAVSVVPGIAGEVGGAGETIRIPRGHRILRARALDGTVVDEATGTVGIGTVQLFVPGSNGYCFRIDRRAYGRARQPRPVSVQLPHDERFHTLNESIDAWFEPNPAATSNAWFAGGVRRAVRHSSCQRRSETGQ